MRLVITGNDSANCNPLVLLTFGLKMNDYQLEIDALGKLRSQLLAQPLTKG
jgi:hypothetical protein